MPLTNAHYIFGQPPEGMDVLWRVEACRYSYTIDADTDTYGVTDPRLEITWYKVLKRTPKGARLADRFILLSATKRWACNTEQEALASFVARKNKQISILTHRLRAAEKDLALASKADLTSDLKACFT